jgi:hypothetical protein
MCQNPANSEQERHSLGTMDQFDQRERIESNKQTTEECEAEKVKKKKRTGSYPSKNTLIQKFALRL